MDKKKQNKTIRLTPNGFKKETIKLMNKRSDFLSISEIARRAGVQRTWIHELLRHVIENPSLFKLSDLYSYLSIYIIPFWF